MGTGAVARFPAFYTVLSAFSVLSKDRYQGGSL